MPERNTSARAVTENTKPSTKYSYNYDYLPPLAIVGAVTEAENFPARPDWISLVARSVLRLLFNTVMIGVQNKGDHSQFVPQVLDKLQAIAQQLGGDAGLSNAIATALEKEGTPATLA